MKFGSVAFFKRLIVTGFLLLVAVSLLLAIVLGVLLAGEKSRNRQLQALLPAEPGMTAGPVAADAPQEPTLDEVTLPYDPVAGNTPVSLAPSFDYQTRYPYMYAPKPQVVDTEDKVCYLTFDDGPSTVTWQVLETLERFGIKATFFVTGANSVLNEDVLLAAARAGHTIGVHTHSHEYAAIYESVDAYLDDFERMYSRILEVTGTAPTVFRFAGGSVNVHNQYVYNDIIAEMVRRGFVFFDWNAAANDAVVGGISRQQVVDNVLNAAAGRDRVVVLMHDRQDNVSTAAALPAIIERLGEQGYRFEPLTAQVRPVSFFYQ